ncbi:Hypothetical predicted protein [Olea europaea subsp. europaea]|uniref:Uncharacterized protein n=1 Tax=Olea europaea subsp. europaea TaxID=158383 RepID=A0A8S0Q1C5_OLEEU|nr:Hypothetical predicted protein [Olea europaea subsp. europaea]
MDLGVHGLKRCSTMVTTVETCDEIEIVLKVIPKVEPEVNLKGTLATKVGPMTFLRKTFEVTLGPRPLGKCLVNQ